MAGGRAAPAEGSSTSHLPCWKRGQRVWKRQPLGGLIGLGTSPSSTMRSRVALDIGVGIGTAESSAWV